MKDADLNFEVGAPVGAALSIENLVCQRIVSPGLKMRMASVLSVSFFFGFEPFAISGPAWEGIARFK